jgi:hypothetical protein
MAFHQECLPILGSSTYGSGVTQVQGPSADQVVGAAPAVLAALGDLLREGACDIPAEDLDVFCVATLNLLAQLSEEYAELAGISVTELVKNMAEKMFTDARQVRKPRNRPSTLNTDGVG